MTIRPVSSCIAGLLRGSFNGASCWPTALRCRMPCSSMACWSSRWFDQRWRRLPAASKSVLPRKGNIMQDRPEETSFDNPLRHLTPAQFMALGGNAVVYVRSIKGSKLSEMMEPEGFEGEDDNED